MLLFIVVAVALYVLFTKPTVLPGHRTSPVQRPVSHTAIPGIPAADQVGDNLLGRAPVEPAADDAETAAEGENTAPEAQE
jgi:hypothetical protein